ncbi:hypothetical protein EW146_g1866, partial [Bondarzewia mesenterica]
MRIGSSQGRVNGFGAHRTCQADSMQVRVAITGAKKLLSRGGTNPYGTLVLRRVCFVLFGLFTIARSAKAVARPSYIEPRSLPPESHIRALHYIATSQSLARLSSAILPLNYKPFSMDNTTCDFLIFDTDLGLPDVGLGLLDTEPRPSYPHPGTSSMPVNLFSMEDFENEIASWKPPTDFYEAAGTANNAWAVERAMRDDSFLNLQEWPGYPPYALGMDVPVSASASGECYVQSQQDQVGVEPWETNTLSSYSVPLMSHWQQQAEEEEVENGHDEHAHDAYAHVTRTSRADALSEVDDDDDLYMTPPPEPAEPAQSR